MEKGEKSSESKRQKEEGMKSTGAGGEQGIGEKKDLTPPLLLNPATPRIA